MILLKFKPEWRDEYYKRIEKYLHLVPPARSSLAERQNRPRPSKAELGMITFLASLHFGVAAPKKDEPEKMGYEDRNAYFCELYDLNPDIFRLTTGSEPMTLDFGPRREVNIGYARGYSTVIPMTTDCYQDYLEKKLDPEKIGPHYVIGPIPSSRRPPYYVYIEGAAHVHALEVEPSVGETKNEIGQATGRQLFRHINLFVPEMEFDGPVKFDGPGRYPKNPPQRLRTKKSEAGPLPTILCCTNSEMGFTLVKGPGEDSRRTNIRSRRFQEIGKDPFEHTIYEVRLSDYNLPLHPKKDASGKTITLLRKRQMCKLIYCYLSYVEEPEVQRHARYYSEVN